jgi:cation:H+ antiporter
MLLVTAGLFVLSWDLSLSRADGVLLLLALAGYLLFVFQSVESEVPRILGEYAEFIEASASSAPKVELTDVGWVLAGSACLVLGGYCIVEGAVQVASALGLSQVVIGLTVVAVGTSLPELATSVVAAARNESDIAVGNVIGSNIFNIAGILGVSSLLAPLPIPPTSLSREFPALMAVSLLLLPLLRTGWRIKRLEGAILLGAYIAAGFYLL